MFLMCTQNQNTFFPRGIRAHGITTSATYRPSAKYAEFPPITILTYLRCIENRKSRVTASIVIFNCRGTIFMTSLQVMTGNAVVKTVVEEACSKTVYQSWMSERAPEYQHDAVMFLNHCLAQAERENCE
ncbi:hypothetical protein ALP91_04881, partial [Pseudomonas savastanoi pv. glycinea]